MQLCDWAGRKGSGVCRGAPDRLTRAACFLMSPDRKVLLADLNISKFALTDVIKHQSSSLNICSDIYMLFH